VLPTAVTSFKLGAVIFSVIMFKENALGGSPKHFKIAFEPAGIVTLLSKGTTEPL
jgi:hypothetical protein